MQIFEDPNGYKVTATTVAVAYNVIEAAGLDYWAVRAGLLAYAPSQNSPPGATYAWPRRGLELNETAPGAWKATLTWSSLNYQYALKIGGQQQQVRCDKEVMHAYAGQIAVPAEFAAAKKGVPIGYDGRTVHGCSIYVPQRTWTESVEIPIADYTFDFEDQVFAVQMAPINAQPFRGYAPGEVLFLGMQAQLSTQNPEFVSAAFEFSMSPNNSEERGNRLTIGTIANVEKGGWEYLDAKFQAVPATGAQTMIPAVDYLTIHRVYDASDFADLNIGADESLPLWQGPIQ